MTESGARPGKILPAGAPAPDFALCATPNRYDASWANVDAFIGALRETAGKS